MTMDPDEVTCRPQLIRTYIICPACGRSAPDAGDGLCQDCRDHARLRAAVGEWARCSTGLWCPMPHEVALLELARELGLLA